MKKKIIIPIIIGLFVILIFGAFLIIIRNKYNIPQDYIAIFHGGEGEKTYETYIYKIDNEQNNYGFRYINVTSTKEQYGSSNWNHTITDKGKFEWTDHAFSVAKKNNAYSYVTVPNDDKKYSIEEFQKRFLMN